MSSKLHRTIALAALCVVSFAGCNQAERAILGGAMANESPAVDSAATTIESTPHQFGFDSPDGTIIVTPDCHDLTVETRNWPADAYVIMEFGSSPPMGPPINSTGSWHFLATHETVPWRVVVFDAGGVEIGHAGEYVTGC